MYSFLGSRSCRTKGSLGPECLTVMYIAGSDVLFSLFHVFMLHFLLYCMFLTLFRLVPDPHFLPTCVFCQCNCLLRPQCVAPASRWVPSPGVFSPCAPLPLCQFVFVLCSRCSSLFPAVSVVPVTLSLFFDPAFAQPTVSVPVEQTFCSVKTLGFWELIFVSESCT